MVALDSTGLSDKFGYFAAYAVPAFLPVVHESVSRALRMVGFALALGIALEFLQKLTPSRSFEVADMAADVAGLAAGAFVGVVLRSFLLHRRRAAAARAGRWAHAMTQPMD